MVDHKSPDAREPARKGMDDAVEATRRVIGEIGADLGSDFEETKDRAMDQAEAAKQGLASQVGETAAALESAAERFGPRSVQGDLFRGAARGLDALSEALRGNSMAGLASDLTAFGRRNPAALFGGAALAGFALARFAQASAPRPASGAQTETEEVQR